MPKRRYIAFELLSAANKADVLRVINFLHARVQGVDPALLKLVFYDARSRLGLLRCGHLQVSEIKTSMSGAHTIEQKKVTFKVLGVSGTMRAARRKFLAPRQAKLSGGFRPISQERKFSPSRR